MGKGKTTIALSLAALIGVPAIATAATEASHFLPAGAPAGYLQINPKTCKFLHAEIDVKPSPNERYARAEDSRDDVKLSCLTRKIDAVQPPKLPKPDTCWTAPPPVAEAPADHQGYHDTQGLSDLRSWLAALEVCEAAR